VTNDTQEDEQQQTEPQKTFGSDQRGLRQAAREFVQERPIEEVPAAPEVPDRIGPDGKSQGIKAEDAADSLRHWREQKDQERAAFEKAVYGEEAPPPAEGEEEGRFPTDEEASKAYELQSGLDRLKDLETQAEARAAEAQRLLDDHAKLTAAQSARQAAAGTLGALQQLIEEKFAAQFPDIRSPADLARLQMEDPLRFAEFEEFKSTATEGLQTFAQQAEQQNTAWAQHHERFGQEQDQAFAKAHPELSDPKVRTEIAQATLAELREAGFNDQDIAKAWNGVAGLPLRHSAVQSLLLDAVRFRLAKRTCAMGAGAKRFPRFSVQGQPAPLALSSNPKSSPWNRGSIRLARSGMRRGC
jgi:hypothetical protein